MTEDPKSIFYFLLKKEGEKKPRDSFLAEHSFTSDPLELVGSAGETILPFFQHFITYRKTLIKKFKKLCSNRESVRDLQIRLKNRPITRESDLSKQKKIRDQLDEVKAGLPPGVVLPGTERVLNLYYLDFDDVLAVLANAPGAIDKAIEVLKATLSVLDDATIKANHGKVCDLVRERTKLVNKLNDINKMRYKFGYETNKQINDSDQADISNILHSYFEQDATFEKQSRFITPHLKLLDAITSDLITLGFPSGFLKSSIFSRF